MNKTAIRISAGSARTLLSVAACSDDSPQVNDEGQTEVRVLLPAVPAGHSPVQGEPR